MHLAVLHFGMYLGEGRKPNRQGVLACGDQAFKLVDVVMGVVVKARARRAHLRFWRWFYAAWALILLIGLAESGRAEGQPGLVPGSYLKLTVRDTGRGMEPSVQERIFDPFFTTKKHGEGTGMGLAVVHGIVAGNGGVIKVGTTPGRGTTFEIYLPRHDSLVFKEAHREETIHGGRERILLIEDERHLIRLWEKVLRDLGYTVVSHANGLEALEAFQAAPQSFDLVITDQTMPHLTGEAVARELLRIRPDIPVILCTGFSHTMTEEKARAMGIRAFLMKPLGRRDLAAAVRRALDRSPT